MKGLHLSSFLYGKETVSELGVFIYCGSCSHATIKLLCRDLESIAKIHRSHNRHV